MGQVKWLRKPDLARGPSFGEPCCKTPNHKVSLQNVRACRLRRRSCPILKRLVDSCNW